MRERGLHEAISRRGDPGVTLDIASAPRFDLRWRNHCRHQLGCCTLRARRPTAILGLFDELALTVMEEAARAGLSIPRDLSVVGFDNITASAYAPPGLTTFEASVPRVGTRNRAYAGLDVIDQKPVKPLTRLIRPALVARGSHGAAPEALRNAEVNPYTKGRTTMKTQIATWRRRRSVMLSQA